MKLKRPKRVKALFVTSADRAKYIKQDNYLPALLARMQFLPPGVYHTTTYHDDWCLLLAQRGSCNCRPEIVFDIGH